MEYQYQNPVIEQPAQTPAPVKLQAAALALGIVSLAAGLIGYFVSLFGSILRVEHVYRTGSAAGGVVGIVLGVIALILGIAALVLGIVGLIRSIRRETRTVKGIIFSAVGLNCSLVAIVFGFLSIFITGVISFAMTYA
jgi:hypothetical protein